MNDMIGEENEAEPSQDENPPVPSPVHANYSVHTEELIKAESNRIITLILEHIKELNETMNNKLGELERLKQNAEIVKTTSDIHEERKVDPNQAEIIYDLETDASKEFLEEISKIINEEISQKVAKLQRELQHDIAYKLKMTGAVVSKEHVSLINKSMEAQRKLPKPAEYFFLDSGHLLKSIQELYDALLDMDTATYDKHVTAANNDFANWVEHVFHQKGLATKMRTAQHRDAVVQEIKVWMEKQ